MKTKYLAYGVISEMIVVALSSIIINSALVTPQANAPGQVYIMNYIIHF
jgi:hypothetical protein